MLRSLSLKSHLTKAKTQHERRMLYPTRRFERQTKTWILRVSSLFLWTLAIEHLFFEKDVKGLWKLTPLQFYKAIMTYNFKIQSCTYFFSIVLVLFSSLIPLFYILFCV